MLLSERHLATMSVMSSCCSWSGQTRIGRHDHRIVAPLSQDGPPNSCLNIYRTRKVLLGAPKSRIRVRGDPSWKIRNTQTHSWTYTGKLRRSRIKLAK